MLRTSQTGFGARAEVEVLLDGLSKAIDRVLAEHAGMSAELIGVYEQLGVVFDVTGKLPSVNTEPEVVRLFAESLRRSFAGAEVSVVRAKRAPTLVADGADDEWLSERIARARELATVIVERRPSSDTGGSETETMIGPVFAGGDFVSAIVLARSAKAPSYRASDMLLVEALTTFCGDLVRNHRLVHELRELSLAMVRALVNAVDQKDEYTSGHSIRVSFYAALLGKKHGLSAADLQMLQWSALLHDVGKIGIRDDVLKKTSRLTEEEFRHIKEHPVRSHKVVEQVPQLAGALDGTLYHHEHYDGCGYPSGLKGEQIPLQARIIQIADVFDALTSTRSYRPANDWRGALAIMAAEAGKTVDPHLRKVFDELIRAQLEGKEEGWAQLTQRANHFAQDSEEFDEPQVKPVTVGVRAGSDSRNGAGQGP